MLKLVSAAAVTFALVLGGCAGQTAGAGASGIPHLDKWQGPYPEQPGNNRWHTPAPPA